jgi:hypothetical protein
LLSHASAGGQLLHPSDVNSSISVVCVSPLSNVVAGIGDAGSSARPTAQIARTLSKFNFLVIDLTSAGSTIPATTVRS